MEIKSSDLLIACISESTTYREVKIACEAIGNKSAMRLNSGRWREVGRGGR